MPYFFENLSRFGGKLAVMGDEQLTYSALESEADGIGSLMQERSLAFCACSNTAESLAAYIGMLRRSVVVMMLDEALDRGLLFRLVEAYSPNYIWCDSTRALDFKGWIPLKDTGRNSLLENPSFLRTAAHHGLALMLTTSGSTGSPKFVRLSYKNISANAEAIAEVLEISPEDRPYCALPMNYTYGLSVMHSHLLYGASLIMSRSQIMTREFWNIFSESGATSLAGVPYTYEILKKIGFLEMDLPSLKAMTVSGGRLDKRLALEFALSCRQKGIRFYSMYGQTEATARMACLPHEMAVEKAGSIGKAVPGGEISLINEEGKRITVPGEVGEIVYRGENVSLGYATNRLDLVKGDENKGVLKTGDMAEFDSDGFFYIKGRRKRFLKMYGKRVNLDEVEEILSNCGYVCGCIGVDDNMRIFTSDDRLLEIKRKISAKLGISPSGIKVERIEGLPRSSSGKVLYSLLEARDA
ncbi:MAG: AMP-binding protein [Clostridiales bacterium]|jgi:acyl-coenzyme A synthetase/AMP-(fatty) acid ligase|nr:AMP-binding protein [Clostridiales bacterium]